MKNMTYRLMAVLSLALLLNSGSTNAQGTADPAALDVYSTGTAITIDGKLDEAVWKLPAPYLLFQAGAVPSGNAYTPTAGLMVKPDKNEAAYYDKSTTQVKMLHNGLDLYIALSSNDKYVCKFDWEGDGMFAKVKNASGADVEFKLYVKGTAPNWELGYEGNADFGSGMGVVNGTIFDSASVDNGYTAEMVIHLDKLGYTAVPAALPVMICIFDPDGYSVAGSPWGIPGVFYKQWWGSEWGNVLRDLKLVNTVVPVELTSFAAISVENGVELSWRTASETNNKGFEVQRSADGVNFSRVAFVEGHGTTADAHVYAYSDKVSGGKYYYRLKQVDMAGAYSYSQTVEVNGAAPRAFALSQNYPNPFNPSTRISFALPVDAKVTLNVYNMLGQLVAAVADNAFAAGTHDVQFNASALSSGLYIYTINAVGVDGSKFSVSRKMSLVK